MKTPFFKKVNKVSILIFFLLFGFSQAIASNETGIEYTMKGSWVFLSENKGEPTIYGNGPLTRFMIWRIDPKGDTALKWAEDEVREIAKRGSLVKQEPKEILLGDRKWYEIRSEVSHKLGPMFFVQWYSQNGTNLIEAILAGPQAEVEANLENIQLTLSDIKNVSAPPELSDIAEKFDIWRACRLSDFKDAGALNKDKVITQMNGLALLTNIEELELPSGKPVTGYLIIFENSRFFINPPKKDDSVAKNEEILYAKKSDLSDGTIIFGGMASNNGFNIKEVKSLGEGFANITSQPVPVKFYEVTVEAN